MKMILSGMAMREADKNTTDHFFVPALVLMERAALAIRDEIKSAFPKDTKVGIIAGPGNNGGDGIALARLLKEEGWNVRVFLAGKRGDLSESAGWQFAIAGAYEVGFVRMIDELSDCGLVVDALLGTGQNRPLSKSYTQILQEVNSWQCRRMALDIPTGVYADSGNVPGEAFRADCTVTFAFEKIGQLVYPGKSYCGTVIQKHIGITTKAFPKDWESGLAKNGGICFSLEKSDLAGLLPERREDGNKGTFGKLLVIAGSRGMAGAAILASMAALRMGCGMVRVLTEEGNRVIMQTSVPEALFSSYEGEPEEEDVEEAVSWADVVLVGPGIGQAAGARALLSYIVNETDKPLIFDADAINLFGRKPQLLKVLSSGSERQMVFTPHVLEMSRLTGIPVRDIKENPIGTAAAFSKEFKVSVALKDASTIICDRDGKTFINESGNSGMATAGSGDVLAGIIASLMAQGVPGGTAAPLGVYLHGLAGDAASERMSAYSMTARDIVDSLPSVLKSAME